MSEDKVDINKYRMCIIHGACEVSMPDQLMQLAENALWLDWAPATYDLNPDFNFDNYSKPFRFLFMAQFGTVDQLVEKFRQNITEVYLSKAPIHTEEVRQKQEDVLNKLDSYNNDTNKDKVYTPTVLKNEISNEYHRLRYRDRSAISMLIATWIDRRKRSKEEENCKAHPDNSPENAKYLLKNLITYMEDYLDNKFRIAVEKDGFTRDVLLEHTKLFVNMFNKEAKSITLTKEQIHEVDKLDSYKKDSKETLTSSIMGLSITIGDRGPLLR